MVIRSPVHSPSPPGAAAGAASVIGTLLVIMIVVLLAAAVMYYVLGVHTGQKADMTSFEVQAVNETTLKIRSQAGGSYPVEAVNILLENAARTAAGLEEADGDGRWDPGETLFLYDCNLTTPTQVTIASSNNVLFSAIVQYGNGGAGAPFQGRTYADGLIATYYSDEAFSTAVTTRIARVVMYSDSGSPTAESGWPLAELGKQDSFSVIFAGLVKIDTEADYTFYLTSDDGSYLTIDGVRLVDNGGLHSPAERQGTRHLKPGYHDIEVRMYEHTGTAVVRLEYSTPAIARQYVQALYHIPTGVPTADFSGTPRGAPAPLTVRFTDLSRDALGWSWSFGDGGTSTEQNPIHTYSTGGTYDVSLTAANSAGSNTKTVPGYIVTGGGSPGFTVTYYGDESWTAVKGSETRSRLRLADNSGVSLGHPSDRTGWPTYIAGSAEQFSVRAEGSLLVGEENDYTFYLTSDDGSYLYVDGATVVDNGGLHSPAERQGTVHLTPGYHDIEVKMYEHTGSAVLRLEYSSSSMARRFVSDVYHIPVQSPVADFSGAPRLGPAPLTVQFTDRSTDATAWSWDFGDGNTSTARNPSNAYKAGTYDVRLTATNDHGSSTRTMAGYVTVGSGTPGFKATYYSDEAWTAPVGSETLGQIRLADSGVSDKANWPAYVLGKQDSFSVLFNGSLNVADEGDYTFYLTSDDGSYLSIDGTQVIDNGGLHGATERQGTVHLTPGYHDIEVKMFEHTGVAMVRLEYSSPVIVRQYVQDVYSA